MNSSKIFVHLGRNGDIINTLPILQHEAQNTGAPAKLLVAAEYAELLEGCSYVEAVIAPKGVQMPDLPTALAWARKHYAKVVNLQVYGRGYHQEHRFPSFILEQWGNAGLGEAWGWPLEFDQRDSTREAALVKKYDDGRPMVLVAWDGISSPFLHAAQLLTALHSVEGANLVDLSQVRAHRFYDLLGLFDKAACLVTIDTAHLHLAHASKVPVIALVTDGPTTWHRSPRRPDHVLYLRYGQFPNSENRLLQAVEKLVGGKPYRAPRFIHAIPMHRMTGNDARRAQRAQDTWTEAFGAAWSPRFIYPTDVKRTAKDLGDHRDFQFVRDLIEDAVGRATDDDIVILSNSDACVLPSIADEARIAVDTFGAFYTHRWDFDRIPPNVTVADIQQRAKWYPGSDLFGFSPAWWREHGGQLPDMLIGCEFVDAVLRQLIKFNGGTELHQCVYHEKHPADWKNDKGSPAKLHNVTMARAWFALHKCDDLDPFGERQANTIRQLRARSAR